MLDESFLNFALAVWDKGGPVAFSAILIAGAWWKFGRNAPTSAESQMTTALKALEARVQANHEAAQESREELKDNMHRLGERVARIEGQIAGH